MEKIVELLPHQEKFLRSDKKFSALIGGIGSGKTYAGALYVITKLQSDSSARGFIGASTYGQLTKSTLSCLFNVLMDLGIPFDYNQNQGKLTIYKTEIICGTMENYNVHRGIEIGWFWLDEAREMSIDAFLVIMGRLRDTNAKCLQGKITTSPKGFDWIYDYFAGDKSTKEFELIHARSADNTFLPEGYLATLAEQYSSHYAKQELEGEFVNVTQGKVYWGFNRKRNVTQVKRDTRLHVWAGMDFNVDPMTCILACLTNDKVYVFDEIFLPSSNTTEMAQILKERGYRNIQIVPDSTGRAIKTSAAGLSDHEILRRAGFKIESAVNPFRMDRYNSMNKLLEEGRLLIDPKCIKLIRDLEQVTFKEGTNVPDTKDKSLTHISDALGYLVYKAHGITRKKSSRTIQL